MASFPFRLRKTFLRLFLALWGALLWGMLTAFTGWFHPGCQVVAPPPENFAPAPPGLPCLPTPPPPGSGGGTSPAATTETGRPVRLTIWNGSEMPFSITLTGPQTYILNVASGESRVFVIQRGVYLFDMMLCGVRAQGGMNLNKMTRLTFKPCSTEKLVEVLFKNKTKETVVTTLSGPGNFVFSIPPGETRAFTIPRGEYQLVSVMCGTPGTRMFEARSHRTLTLVCP